jgi:hypothetical protein
MDYRHRPASFVEGALGLTFELVGEQHWQPRRKQDAGSVFVRAAPYTGGPRFRGWATTAEAAAAAIGASEALSGVRGLGNDFAKPSIGGVTVSVRAADGTYHGRPERGRTWERGPAPGSLSACSGIAPVPRLRYLRLAGPRAPA